MKKREIGYVVVAIAAALFLGGLLIYYFGGSVFNVNPYVFLGLTVFAAIVLYTVRFFAPTVLSIHDLTHLYVSMVLFILVVGFIRMSLVAKSGGRRSLETMTFIPLLFYFLWAAVAKITNNAINMGDGGIIYSDI